MAVTKPATEGDVGVLQMRLNTATDSAAHRVAYVAKLKVSDLETLTKATQALLNDLHAIKRLQTDLRNTKSRLDNGR